VPGGDTTLGTPLELAICSTAATQTFSFTNGQISYTSPGNVTRCLNVLGGSATSGNIGLWDCGAFFNEQFTIRGPVTSMGQCVEMSGGIPYEGVPIGVAPCVSGAPRQIWEYYW